MDEKKKTAFRKGVNTLIALAVLTILEFYVSNLESNVIPLLTIGILKAGIIMEAFMHFSQLWAEGEGGH